MGGHEIDGRVILSLGTWEIRDGSRVLGRVNALDAEPWAWLTAHATYHRIAVDARHPDGVTKAVQQHHGHEEQDLVPQVGHLEDVLQVLEHVGGLPGVSDARPCGARTQRLVNWLPLTGGRPCLNGSGNRVTLPPAALMASAAACDTA